MLVAKEGFWETAIVLRERPKRGRRKSNKHAMPATKKQKPAAAEAHEKEAPKKAVLRSTEEENDEIREYRALCDKYGVKPSGSFMVALRHRLSTLKFTADNGVLMEDQLLPISDFYLDAPADKKPRFCPAKWDFSGCAIASNGVALIAALLRAHLPIHALKVHRCRVGPRGFDFISEVLESDEGLPPTLRSLDIGENLCYTKSGVRFGRALARGHHALEKLDASNSRLSFAGVKQVEHAVEKINAERKKSQQGGELHAELYGNLVLDEVWNSITHGVGLLLALVGMVLLVHQYAGKSACHWWGSVAFGGCMVLLYASSLFYHCFFKLLPAKNVFHRFDRFSIYFLIAGSYTPICLINLHGRIGFMTTAAVWTLALVGLVLDIFYFGRMQRLKLSLYLGMGWLCALIALPIATHPSVPITPPLFWWLLAGGLCYTGGVFFYVHDEEYTLYHAYWHVCVLFGTACHYVAIYRYVLPIDSFPDPPVDRFYYPRAAAVTQNL